MQKEKLTQFKSGDRVMLIETATSIGNIDFSLCVPGTIDKKKAPYRKWRWEVIRYREDEHDVDGNTCVQLRRLDIRSHPTEIWSPALVRLCREGE